MTLPTKKRLRAHNEELRHRLNISEAQLSATVRLYTSLFEEHKELQILAARHVDTIRGLQKEG